MSLPEKPQHLHSPKKTLSRKHFPEKTNPFISKFVPPAPLCITRYALFDAKSKKYRWEHHPGWGLSVVFNQYLTEPTSLLWPASLCLGKEIQETESSGILEEKQPCKRSQHSPVQKQTGTRQPTRLGDAISPSPNLP